MLCSVVPHVTKQQRTTSPSPHCSDYSALTAAPVVLALVPENCGHGQRCPAIAHFISVVGPNITRYPTLVFQEPLGIEPAEPAASCQAGVYSEGMWPLVHSALVAPLLRQEVSQLREIPERLSGVENVGASIMLNCVGALGGNPLLADFKLPPQPRMTRSPGNCIRETAVL
jgi:hypothetical protein